jgi:DNA-binding NarL/FixJ family response regulator
MAPYRIVLADDHRMFRAGIRQLIQEAPGLEVAAEVGDGMALLDRLKESVPDLVLLDISMPNLRGIEAAAEIKSLYPEVKILVLTMHKRREYCLQCLAAGADGYLLKEDADVELFSAIDAIRQGRVYISPLLSHEVMTDFVSMAQGRLKLPDDPLSVREREVLQLIGEGKSSKEIGDLLFISPRTVEHHRTNIMKKLHLRGAADLIRYAVEREYHRRD